MNQTVQGSENDDSLTPLPRDLIVQTAVLAMTEPPNAEISWTRATTAFLNSAVDSAGTRRAYARHLKRAGELFSDAPVSLLNGNDLVDYRAAVTASGWSPSTQAQALSAVRSFLTWSGSIGGHRLPAEVITTALRTPRATVRTRFNVVSEKEIQSMLAAAPSSRERALLAVLLGAGVRVAEAANLDVNDIIEDMDGGVSLFIRQGKGRKDRVVPIRPEVDGLLRAYLEETHRYLGCEGPLFLAVDRGVKGRRDAGMTTRSLARLVTQLARTAGIAAKRVTPHALRHTYAIRCLRSGGNVVAVAHLLGHSSISTTQRYVDHLAVSELRSTVPALPLLQGPEQASA